MGLREWKASSIALRLKGWTMSNRDYTFSPASRILQTASETRDGGQKPRIYPRNISKLILKSIVHDSEGLRFKKGHHRLINSESVSAVQAVSSSFGKVSGDGHPGRDRHRAGNLARCRDLLGVSAPVAPPPSDYRERYRQLTGQDLFNARSARKVRCGGPVFSRRAPQPPDGTVHEAMLRAMPVLAEASLSPRPAQKSVSAAFASPRSVPIAPQIPVFLGFPHCKTHPTRFSQLHSFPSRFVPRYLSNTETFQNT